MVTSTWNTAKGEDNIKIDVTVTAGRLMERFAPLVLAALNPQVLVPGC